MLVPWNRIPWYRGKPGESRLRRILRATVMRVIVYGLVLLALAPFNCCDGLFYYPTQEPYSTLADHPQNGGIEEVWFTSRDGTRLNGWFMRARGPARASILHFHGNAGNLTSHVSFVDWLPAQGFNVLVWDYRGYGKSEGSPSRDGIHDDGLAALAYLRSRPDVDASRIIIFGQSLGGAVALDVAAHADPHELLCVVADSTFASYQQQANTRLGGSIFTMPLVWALIGESHSPRHTLPAISPTPLLVVHGTDDSIVPYSMGREVFETAREPKALWTIPHGEHTDAFSMYGPEWRPKLVEYFMQGVRQTQ